CGHEHPKCGWRGVPDGDALIRQRGVPTVDLELTLIDDARHAMGQWGDDPVRGSRNPAGVSGAPEDVVGMEVERERPGSVVLNNSIVDVDGTFGSASGPTREVEERHCFGVGCVDFVAPGHFGEKV